MFCAGWSLQTYRLRFLGDNTGCDVANFLPGFGSIPQTETTKLACQQLIQTSRPQIQYRKRHTSFYIDHTNHLLFQTRTKSRKRGQVLRTPAQSEFFTTRGVLSLASFCAGGYSYFGCRVGHRHSVQSETGRRTNEFKYGGFTFENSLLCLLLVAELSLLADTEF